MENEEIKTEDGMNNGARNFGRFWLAAIPLVLGAAAATWFGLWVSGHNYSVQIQQEKHEATQQDRMAVYVGASVRPTKKLAIEIVNKDGCLTITRADIDTKRERFADADVYSLVLYAQKTTRCPDRRDYVEWHWETLSPAGVLLKGGYTNQCPSPGIGEIAECSFDVGEDSRADRLRVWTSQPY